MKKKIILGLLAIILLLFLTIFSWALDYDSYLRSRHQEHPEQESSRIPVVPQTTTPLPSTASIIILPTGQNLPAIIYMRQSSAQAQEKVRDLAKNSNTTVRKVSKTK